MTEPDELTEAGALAYMDRATNLMQLYRALAKVPNCMAIPLKKRVRCDLHIHTTYAHEDALRIILKQFGLCPMKRALLPPIASVGGHYRRQRIYLRVRLPSDW